MASERGWTLTASTLMGPYAIVIDGRITFHGSKKEVKAKIRELLDDAKRARASIESWKKLHNTKIRAAAPKKEGQ